MAIDDNTLYGLTGAQVKELPGKIEAVKGKAKVLTAADYNWPTTGTKTTVALWLLEPGIYYKTNSNVDVKLFNSSFGSVGVEDLCIVGNSSSFGRIVMVLSSRTTDTFGRVGIVNVDGSIVKSVNINKPLDNLTTSFSGTALDANQGKVLKDLIDSLIIKGTGAPTTSTVGTVGKLYEDTTNGDLYICTDTTGGSYTWAEVGAGGGSGPSVVQTIGTSTTDVMSQKAVGDLLCNLTDYPTEVNAIRIGAYATNNSYGGSIAIGNSSSVGTGKQQTVTIGPSSQAQYDYALACGASAKAQATHAVAIGDNATASARGSVALGTRASASTQGEVNIGTSATANGYNSSNYRLISGVYDGQSAHDAATKGQLDSIAIRNAGAPTTATVGTVGQLLEDTTNGKLYICTDATNPYVWEEVGSGGGSGPTVVQSTGTSTTDVMSQNAVTGMIFNDPGSYSNVAIGTGVSTSAYNNVVLGRNAVGSSLSVAIGGGVASRLSAQATGNYTVAIGADSAASGSYSIALGSGSRATVEGQFDVGASNNNGYNSSNYRLLTGLYDPQSDHDAATKGYVDTAIAGAGTSAFTTNEWNALWA